MTCVAWTMQRKRRRGTCDLWGLCTPVPFGWFRPARWRWERPGQCACMLAPWRAGRCAAGSAAAHGCRGSREWPAWMGPAGIRGCVFASMSCLYWCTHGAGPAGSGLGCDSGRRCVAQQRGGPTPQHQSACEPWGLVSQTLAASAWGLQARGGRKRMRGLAALPRAPLPDCYRRSKGAACRPLWSKSCTIVCTAVGVANNAAAAKTGVLPHPACLNEQAGRRP